MRLKQNWSWWQSLASYVYAVPIDQSGLFSLDLVKNKLVLQSPNANQSGRELKWAFEDVISAHHILDRQPQSMLILGLGLGSVIEIILMKYIPKNIVAYESSTIVTQWFDTYYDHEVTLIEETINDKTVLGGENYDLIVIDLFEDDRIPDLVLQPAFWQQIRSKLGPKGIIIWNTLGHHQVQIDSSISAYFNKSYGSIWGNVFYLYLSE